MATKTKTVDEVVAEAHDSITIGSTDVVVGVSNAGNKIIVVTQFGRVLAMHPNNPAAGWEELPNVPL